MVDELFESYNTLNRQAVQEYHEYLALLKKAGVERVVGLVYQWFYPNQHSCAGMAVPPRDLMPASLYQAFLEMFREMWYIVASEFREIDLWETGNELNHAPFNHPLSYPQTGETFNTQQRVDVMCDMMFSAKQAIKLANPGALVAMPGLAPVEIINETPRLVEFLELVYSSITGGRYQSADPNDYFDILAWHPYTQNRAPSAEWLEYQWQIYNIACSYEKKPKPVYFTEIGWTDFGDAAVDSEQARYYTELYEMVRSKLPFVEMMMYFRLFEDTPLADWGGASEITFGMFREPQNGLRAKAKAFAFQAICGGSGDLRRFEKTL